MPDTDLSGDAAKLVRYTLLTVQRETERVLEQGELLVTDDMSAQGFRAWVLGRHGGADDRGNRFLRVSFDVLARYEREPRRHRERQIAVLEEIRDALRQPPPPPVIAPAAPVRKQARAAPPRPAAKPVVEPPPRPPATPPRPRRSKGS